MSVQVSYKKQTLLGLILLLIVLIVIEGSARISDYFFPTGCYFLKSDLFKNLETSKKRQLCNDFRNLKFTNEPFYQILPNQEFSTININSHGFRGPEIMQTKNDNIYRIFVIGGSTTFGTGSLSDQTTIPSILEKKLNSNDLPYSIEVINAGISAAFSATEHRLIKEQILEFEPDLLIIYDGINDVSKELKYYHEGSEEEATLSIEKERTAIYELQQIVFRNSKTAQWYYSNIDDIRTSISGLDVHNSFEENTIQEKVEIWKNRWKEICELGHSNNFKVILTIQPILGSSDRTLTEYEHKHYVWNDNEKKLQALQNYVDALSELDSYCKETSDLRNSFDGINQPIFTDSAHMSDFGNEIIAKKLSEISLPIILDDIKYN